MALSACGRWRAPTSPTSTLILILGRLLRALTSAEYDYCRAPCDAIVGAIGCLAGESSARARIAGVADP